MNKKFIMFFVLMFVLLLVSCGEDKKAEFSFEESNKTLEVGQEYTINYELTEGFEVEFILSKAGVVSITGTTIKALAIGEVDITAKVKDTNVSKVMKVTVVAPQVIAVDSVSITGLNAGLTGATITLTATILPTNATNKTVTWTSSDETLATVSNGVVTLIKVGSVTITATAGEKSKTHVITITEEAVAVTSVTIAGENVGLVGENVTLTATVLPENATNKTVTWASSDEDLATVTNGVVTLLQEGTVTITASAGGVSETHEIVISNPVIEVESIQISGENVGLVGEDVTLTATVLPENATNKTVTWTSSDEDLATVTNGVVTLLQEGTVTITASAGGLSETHEIVISNPVVDVESIQITGENTGLLGNDLTLIAVVLPENATNKTVTWASSDEDLATVTNGVVTLLQEGTVTITATSGSISESFLIDIVTKAAAFINEVGYVSIKNAINAAAEGDTIIVNTGTYDEAFTIDKSINLLGFENYETILTNKITIAANMQDIKISGFKMTENFQVASAGTLEGFEFINNDIYDTNLTASAYAPITRTSVNAIIQFYVGAGSNIFGDITINDNIFTNIKSDIIALDRTMAGKEINIKNNEFRNYQVGAIRFDGGYNSGTYNIEGNKFINDSKQAEAAIVFRAYSASAGNTQIINIIDNEFVNIGNVENNRNDGHPGSGVIVTSTYNVEHVEMNILDNSFVNTHNSIHLRKADLDGWAAEVSGNNFENTTGYMFYEDGNVALITNNIYKDINGDVVDFDDLDKTVTESLTIIKLKEILVESIVITGDEAGIAGDIITLLTEVLPLNATNKELTWTSSDEELATVIDGVVTLLQEGTVTITASAGEVSHFIDIVISPKMAAFINEEGYLTIALALDAAIDGDVININTGTYDDALTINKKISLVGSANYETILTNKITIGLNMEDISISGFKMTGNFQVVSTGTLKGFIFTDNDIYDTDLAATAYLPASRTNVNAIIQLYAGTGTNVFGDITITNNIFNNIKSDIIAIDRTMANEEININNNEFRNYKVGAIRFDGGYNNGTYNINENTFYNDSKQAEAAIVFRAYSSNASNTQTINIIDNTFTNIGNPNNNRTDGHPGSGVIVTSTFNDVHAAITIQNNEFTNTHNSIHFRKAYTGSNWTADVSNNTFENTTGYMYYEDGDFGVLTDNIYKNDEGNIATSEELDNTLTDTLTIIKLKEIIAEYKVVYHTYNSETESYDTVEETLTEVVGKVIVITPEAKLGYYTEHSFYSGVVLKDNSLVIEIYYELEDPDIDNFIYELELNGGNFEYEDRLALVNDFIKDYNAVTGKSNTLENMSMAAFTDVDYHRVFFEVNYRNKWLWLAQYLSVVGSAANKNSARDVVQSSTASEFTGKSSNWIYAFSYEMRGFLKGVKHTENALWHSSDYSDLALKDGFWPTYAQAKISSEYLSSGLEETLPTDVYKEGYSFLGWYLNENLTGDPVLMISEPVKLYAKWEERTPMTSLVISNKINELLKGDTHQLAIDILPIDAFNQTVIYESSDIKVLIVDEAGLITAVNAGTAKVTVKNYNSSITDELTITVYPKDDIDVTFSEGFNGYVNVDDEFSINVEAFGKQREGLAFTFTITDTETLELVGTNGFKALLPGVTFINIYHIEELLYTYKVIVQDELEDTRVDDLLAILANANNAVTTPLNVIPYYTASQEWSDPRYESVNAYLFDDFVVDRTTYLADPTLKASGLRTSTEFILIHDTANLNGGLLTHGSFFQNPSNSVSIHYTTGDYGILQTLDDRYVAWHAGDGTSVAFEWIATGITANGTEKPVIDLSTDGYFTFNGIKSTVLAPKGNSGQILDKSYFTYQGPTWDIQEGKYVIGTSWFSTGQQSRGVISSRGGNRNSVGIEMNVNRDGDIVDTVQRTAKLVANLLEQFNLENHKVIMHNTTDGKGDPYTLNNTVYKGTWYFDRFMEHVSIEREILKNYSDATITFSSTSDLVSSTGRIIKMPEVTTSLEYTVTVTIDGVTKSINLVSVVPGINTWSQNYGFFTPTQPWAKADYRK